MIKAHVEVNEDSVEQLEETQKAKKNLYSMMALPTLMGIYIWGLHLIKF